MSGKPDELNVDAPETTNESVNVPQVPLYGGARVNSSKSSRTWQIGNLGDESKLSVKIQIGGSSRSTWAFGYEGDTKYDSLAEMTDRHDPW